MPGYITARIEEALAALYRHPERTLLPWYRYAIYTALTLETPLRGHAARVWLDVVAARHVLFFWQPYARGPWPRLWPQPEQLLTLAEQVMEGRADQATVSKQVNRAHALADVAGEDVTSLQYCAWCVYEAALRALNSAWAYDRCASVPQTACVQTRVAAPASRKAVLVPWGGETGRRPTRSCGARCFGNGGCVMPFLLSGERSKRWNERKGLA